MVLRTANDFTTILNWLLFLSTCVIRQKEVNVVRNLHYYTTQAVRGPITKINQSKCSIACPIMYSLSIGPGIVPNDPALVSLQSCNKSLINQACSAPYWENIGPHFFLYGPRCARSVLSRPRAHILPVRPSHLVSKIYILPSHLVNNPYRK